MLPFNVPNKITLTLNLQELIDELGIYLLQYDRAGYGESDPNPKRSLKSEALDIEELADRLQIGPKFYVIGVSMGSYATWSCLNYIPNRQISSLRFKICHSKGMFDLCFHFLLLILITKM